MTNCVENASCMPVNPLDVLNIFDVWFGSPFSLIFMALILGTVTLAIYIRNRSLPMLVILGFYEIAAFGIIITNKIFAAQYHVMEVVLILGITTAVTMMVLRLVKE